MDAAKSRRGYGHRHGPYPDQTVARNRHSTLQGSALNVCTSSHASSTAAVGSRTEACHRAAV